MTPEDLVLTGDNKKYDRNETFGIDHFLRPAVLGAVRVGLDSEATRCGRPGRPQQTVRDVAGHVGFRLRTWRFKTAGDILLKA